MAKSKGVPVDVVLALVTVALTFTCYRCFRERAELRRQLENKT